METKRIGINEKIKEARQVAWKVLKPSRKELEHGMELHANSVVVEAYGFARRSALEGDKIRAAIEEGASEAEIQDMIEDMYMTRCVTTSSERAEFMTAREAAGGYMHLTECG